MLLASPLPPRDAMTPGAQALAFPDHSPAAREAMARAEQAGAVVPLDLEALRAEAIRRANGLTDFGPAPLDEPLGILCRSLAEELDFHPLGRVQVFEQIVGLLTTRLRLEALWRAHPEILDLRVERPIVIIGLPRSGTTILHRLLACDIGRRASPFWEQVMPLPVADPIRPGATGATRRARMAKSLEMLDAVVPELRRMHELTLDQPDEDLSLLIFAFASMQFEWSYRVPAYARWYAGADHHEGYRYFRRVLQTLQWLRGGERWILKAPQHLERLGPLLSAFPDAVLVQTHRDPVPAVISLSSLTSYGARRYFAHPNPHAIGADMADIVERLLSAGMRERPDGVVDIAFEALLADPIACVRRIYTAAGDALTPETEAAMAEWIADNRQGKHGGHTYDAADFGLDVNALRDRFAPYVEQFDVPIDKRFAGAVS